MKAKLFRFVLLTALSLAISFSSYSQKPEIFYNPTPLVDFAVKELEKATHTFTCIRQILVVRFSSLENAYARFHFLKLKLRKKVIELFSSLLNMFTLTKCTSPATI